MFKLLSNDVVRDPFFFRSLPDTKCDLFRHELIVINSLTEFFFRLKSEKVILSIIKMIQ